jgi:hypothetical protein
MDRWEDILRRTARTLFTSRPAEAAATPDAISPPQGPRIDGDVGLVVRPDIDDAVWKHRRPASN